MKNDKINNEKISFLKEPKAKSKSSCRVLPNKSGAYHLQGIAQAGGDTLARRIRA